MCLCAHINVCVRAESSGCGDSASQAADAHDQTARISPHEISTSERTDIAKRNLNPHTHVSKIRKSFFSIFIVKWISVVGMCARVCVCASGCESQYLIPDAMPLSIPTSWITGNCPSFCCETMNRQDYSYFPLSGFFHFSALERILQVRRFITTSQKMS